MMFEEDWNNLSNKEIESLFCLDLTLKEDLGFLTEFKKTKCIIKAQQKHDLIKSKINKIPTIWNNA